VSYPIHGGDFGMSQNATPTQNREALEKALAYAVSLGGAVVYVPKCRFDPFVVPVAEPPPARPFPTSTAKPVQRKR
jgi:hypothetical protein